jgi:adenylate kinase family enzyme
LRRDFPTLKTLSTGDLLREQILQATDLGRQAEDLMAKGDLLPDSLMAALVQSTLHAKYARADPWVLDGFPRTLDQAVLLDDMLQRAEGSQPLNLVINLDVPHQTILKRIQGKSCFRLSPLSQLEKLH